MEIFQQIFDANVFKRHCCSKKWKSTEPKIYKIKIKNIIDNNAHAIQMTNAVDYFNISLWNLMPVCQ